MIPRIERHVWAAQAMSTVADRLPGQAPENRRAESIELWAQNPNEGGRVREGGKAPAPPPENREAEEERSE